MSKFALVGSTQFAARFIHYLESTGFGVAAGMFDDFEEVGAIKHDRPILGRIDDIPLLYKKGAFEFVMIAIGYNNFAFRKKVFEFLQSNSIPIETFIHPTAYIEKGVIIKTGSVVLVNAVVEMNSTIHENVFISSECYISHHVDIQPHTYLSPAVKVAGNSRIGESCFLGISTTVIDAVKIGDRVQTAGGAVVIKDVPSSVLIAGVPGVVKKRFD